MPSTGAASAPKQLSRERAIEILAFLPMLVAQSNTYLKPNQIILSEYEVEDSGIGSFKFESQPFRVMRHITRDIYLAAVGVRARNSMCVRARYYYELHSD